VTGAALLVRPAEPGDADAIRGLDGLAPASGRLLRHDLTTPDRCCLVATLGAELAGYAAATVQGDEAQVLDVVVAPERRGRGVGHRLLAALLAASEHRGAPAVSLEVAVSNRAARALYRRHGFVVEGRRPRYYPDGQDALILWRRPTAAREED
jgi:[ribosomal protein S18]-alanine N-acetyltransferase